MATESIMMAGVAAGGDRQDLHERIRVHSQAAALQVKQEAMPNDLFDRLKKDPAFAKVLMESVTDPSAYVGRAPEQVAEFLTEVLKPIFDKNPTISTEMTSEVKV